MKVIFKDVPIELPEPTAILLLQRGAAHLPETSVVDPRTQSEPSGIPTPRGRGRGTGSKPSKPYKGSSKTGTKSPSTPSTGSKAPRRYGTGSRSTREG